MTRPVLGGAKAALACATLSLALIGGCPEPAEPVRVELANETALDVTPNFYVSADQTTTEAVFVPANLQTNFTDRPFPELRGGESATLTFDCERIRALGVSNAVFFDPALLTVNISADQVFELRGGFFDCGSSVRIVYFREGTAYRVRIE